MDDAYAGREEPHKASQKSRPQTYRIDDVRARAQAVPHKTGRPREWVGLLAEDAVATATSAGVFDPRRPAARGADCCQLVAHTGIVGRQHHSGQRALGTTDVAGLGRECDTGDPGVCGPGRATCQDGTESCVPLAMPTAERCNNTDDDCDGETDETLRNQAGECCADLLQPLLALPPGARGQRPFAAARSMS